MCLRFAGASRRALAGSRCAATALTRPRPANVWRPRRRRLAAGIARLGDGGPLGPWFGGAHHGVEAGEQLAGDGGGGGRDKLDGGGLQARGEQVIGVDSLRYFWSERTPEEIARDTTAMIQKADPTGKLPVAVLGYSFGADTFPFAWKYLDPALQDRTKMIGLLGVETTTTFQVSIEGWLGMDGDKDVVPAITTIPLDRVVCVYGEEEDDTACTAPELKGAHLLTLSGAHHFDENHQPMAAALLDKMRSLPGLPPRPSS